MSHSKVLITFAKILTMIIITTQSQKTCFDSDNNPCNVCLSQSDFDAGTYRILQTGIYCLVEDILFNPIPGSSDEPNAPNAWFPTDGDKFPGSTTLDNGGFALGFFATISIEADNVKLDLKGFTIEWSFDFYVQQRFGAHIEIANQPFLPNTGPAIFGENMKEITNVEIKNGVLGLISHHGIHSNNATNVFISDLKINNFEVSAIQLNGFFNAEIRNIIIGPTLQKVPVTGLSFCVFVCIHITVTKC